MVQCFAVGQWRKKSFVECPGQLAGLPAYSPIVVSCMAKDTWKFPLLPSLVPTGRRWQVEEKSTKK